MTRAAPFAAFALLATMIVLGCQAAVALGATVKAGDCAFANSGTATGNTLNCNFGLTPEQLKQATEAAVKGVTEPLTHQIVEISKILGVTEDATKNLLKIVGEDPNISDDKLAEALTKVAGDYKRLQTQVAALNPDNPTAKALVEQAKLEIDAGHFQRAHELLQQASLAEIAAAQEAYKVQEQARTSGDAHMLKAASSTAAEGDVAMTERRYVEAADLFGQAASYVPGGHASEHGGYLLRQEDALYRQGDERGDNAALRSAIQVCERALADYPRDRVPLEWARTQVNLGNALKTLGERETGTQSLNAAVAAYRAALQEQTRDRVPLDWARTQMNLGNALETLGEREPGTQSLTAAVAAYRAALQEQTRDRVPLDWAMTQVNLGNALKALGEREPGTQSLTDAVAAFHAALEELTRDRVPLNWAKTQVNLGNALERLGERETGTQSLTDAVAAYRAALQEETRDRVPLFWASAQMNLGIALARLGEREPGTQSLTDAVAAFRAALEERTRDRVPPEWAKTQMNIGVALATLGERETGTQSLTDAVAAFRAALEENPRDRVPLAWAYCQHGLANTLALLADRTNNAPLQKEAIASMQGAIEVYRQSGESYWLPIAEKRLNEMQAKVAPSNH